MLFQCFVAHQTTCLIGYCKKNKNQSVTEQQSVVALFLIIAETDETFFHMQKRSLKNKVLFHYLNIVMHGCSFYCTNTIAIVVRSVAYIIKQIVQYYDMFDRYRY